MISPLQLFIRVVLATVLVLGVGHWMQRGVLQGLSPAIRWTVEAVQDDFHISSVQFAAKGQSQVLRMGAQLSKPLQVEGRWLYPQNWLGAPVGAPQVSGLQVELTAGGTLSYSLMVFIVVLAWPAAGLRVLVCRLLWAMPLSALLLAVNVSTLFPAELWTLVHDTLAPQALWPLLVWSRMFMGGVGLVLAVGAGFLAVVLGAGSARWQQRPT